MLEEYFNNLGNQAYFYLFVQAFEGKRASEEMYYYILQSQVK